MCIYIQLCSSTSPLNRRNSIMRLVRVRIVHALRGLCHRRTAPSPQPQPPLPKPPCSTTTNSCYPGPQEKKSSTSTTSVVGPQVLRPLASLIISASKGPSESYGQPCLDFYFHKVPTEVPEEEEEAEEDTRGSTREYLNKLVNQLLPQAWSQDPLTTLKIICNLHDKRSGTGKNDEYGFYTAAFWLHYNHPKTLASNLASIAHYFGGFGGFHDFVEILYLILAAGGHDHHQVQVDINQNNPRVIDLLSDEDYSHGLTFRDKDELVAMANELAIQRYQRDPNYRFLHDQISEFFAHYLKSDIHNLKSYIHHQKHDDDNDQSHDHNSNNHNTLLELTLAADACDERLTLLCDSIASKVFPRESFREYQGLKEADYLSRVRDRLCREVLMPLRKATDNFANQWGYELDFEEEPCSVLKSLEDLISSGDIVGNISASAMLPHQIMRYVKDAKLGQVAELQWKAMVEDLKQGSKLRSCLAVCDHSPSDYLNQSASLALGILVSELSEEPWRGLMINFSRNPRLYSVVQVQEGHPDLDDYLLKSKCQLVERTLMMDSRPNEGVDFRKVFDLILEVAVKGSLKPEQMIKKVFVFTSLMDFDEACANDWETDYEAIKSKFKEQGYGQVVPKVVFWNMTNIVRTPVRPTRQGVAMLSGFNDSLVKSFLDNDGEIGPVQVMEALIAGQGYQTLVVVD